MELITLMEMQLTHTKPTAILPLTFRMQMTITHVHQKDKVSKPVKLQPPIMLVKLLMGNPHLAMPMEILMHMAQTHLVIVLMLTEILMPMAQTHLVIVLMPKALMHTEIIMPMAQTHLDIGMLRKITTTAILDPITKNIVKKVVLRTFKKVQLTTPRKWSMFQFQLER